MVIFFFFKQKTAYEMLRSLVGSEMCIRDRNSLEYKAFTMRAMGAEPLMVVVSRNEMWGTYAPRPFDKVRVQLISTVFETCMLSNHTFISATHNVVNISNGADCLLYTSDAADEEDSVDIGGRRLIKKKKIWSKRK
eukprot:TRINITY_DN35681_c0_g1_i1.p1 TRINITY_DN35681_c0_g1~~TRINITY_DN35681_c0_g1_i1.p1  ORF type:complete len:136 (-),score=34.83 TRINITY_DN35681_c0_g1_i1:24-431(-)